MELDISKMYMLIMNWVYEKPLRTKSGQNIDHITQRTFEDVTMDEIAVGEHSRKWKIESKLEKYQYLGIGADESILRKKEWPVIINNLTN